MTELIDSGFSMGITGYNDYTYCYMELHINHETGYFKNNLYYENLLNYFGNYNLRYINSNKYYDRLQNKS